MTASFSAGWELWFQKEWAKIGRSIATNKTNKQTTIFLPMMNKVFLSPILQNLKGKFGQIFWKWSSQQAEKDAVKQKVLSFHKDGQKQKMVIKIEFTLLSSDCKMLPFLKGFKR